MVPPVALYMRHIPQPYSSKQMTVIQPSGVQLVVRLLQINWDMLVTSSIPEFNLKKKICTS
jgi:hypothetical protein